MISHSKKIASSRKTAFLFEIVLFILIMLRLDIFCGHV
jgi:hypothetical protein